MSPRDGLQNEKQSITLEHKIELISRLGQAGLNYIEVGAFVREDMVPQMAGTSQLLETLAHGTGVTHAVLVPNMYGLHKALEHNVKEIAVFTAASETFNQKNIHASIDESLRRFEPVLKEAKANNINVRAYISTAFVCPYEGNIDVKKVTPLIEKLLAMGCYEVSIGDTIGKASRPQVKKLFEETHHKKLNSYLAGHFHDTYGQALDNIHCAIEHDIKVFDACVGGIGGCPYAPGAPGNVATESLVAMLDKHGILRSESIDINRLEETSVWVKRLLKKESDLLESL